MSQLRKKTIAAEAREYLLKARELGIPLSWNHYEAIQPQDGFMRLGLSCADCMLGPCRLDPFARRETKTVCGLGKEELVKRSVLRLLKCDNYELSPLKAAQALAACGEESVAGLPVIGGERQVGLGTLQYGHVNILAEGLSADALKKLTEAAKNGALAEKSGANGFSVVLAGDISPHFDIPAACTEGTVELALLTGLVDGYVTGKGATGLGRNAAACLHTATTTAGCEFDAEAFLAASAGAYRNRDVKNTQMELAVEQVQFADENAVKQAVAGCGRVAVFGGGSNLKLVVDELVVDAAQSLAASGTICLAYGNAAVALAKYGIAGENIFLVGSNAMLPQAAALTAGKQAAALMPELSKPSDFAAALTLGGAGLPVLTATELPVEGAAELADDIHKTVAFAAPEDYLLTAGRMLGLDAVYSARA